MALRRMLFAAWLLSTACTTAHADRPAVGSSLAPQIALGIAPTKLRAPYDVQILRENGEALPTFHQKDRFYVQGNANERYVIRITNPTDHRIEAVVSVDGLDVIDGENGDLRKRGYVVPPFGETRIEGFRTSQADVATFRFSSVAGSYAGQKGKARNVGVIAVALFEEHAPEPAQQIIVGEAGPPPPPGFRPPYDYRGDLDAGRTAAADNRPAKPGGRVAKAGPASEAGAGASRAKRAEAPAAASVRAPMPPPDRDAGRSYVPPSDNDADDESLPEPQPQTQQRERLGLGTEFGETRYSAASYTQFVRAPGRPVALAELRYNDTAGLMALGIPVHPLPDAGEIMTRETADPFPGDRFAQPSRR
jgi:hypothetical protein